MKVFGMCCAVFMAGVVASLNLGMLIETNPEYGASWMKFGFACFIALFFSIGVVRSKSR